MAFMAATMLHKEYGTTRSPWYSIGGYTVATATAVSRMLNNKHWLSDVMVGAGIGILSTEVGYFLTDLIFKDKGLTHSYLGFETFNYQRNPSFFGIYMGFSLMPTKFNLAPDVRLKASPGSTAGFEGAWFMNRYMLCPSRYKPVFYFKIFPAQFQHPYGALHPAHNAVFLISLDVIVKSAQLHTAHGSIQLADPADDDTGRFRKLLGN